VVSVLITLAVAGLAQAQAQDHHVTGGQIRGVLDDPAGAALGGGSVRVLESPSNRLETRAIADDYGRFQTGMLNAGSYTVIAWMQGFRAGRFVVSVHNGETTDLGKIRLGLGGCDAPGVNCDYFGMGPADPIAKSGYMDLATDCAGDLLNGKSYCSGTSEGPPQPGAADLRLARDQVGIYLVAVDRAVLSVGCRDVKPNETRIRVDGLGRGDDVCVQTHDGLRSHVFFATDVEPTSQSIRLWYVTRRH
jgi:hypothetical protein